MRPSPSPARPRLRVAILLADRFTLSAFANFVDVLRLAADEADRSRPILCSWSVLSDSLAPVRSSSGVRVTPDTRLKDAGAFDYVVVVGGVMGDRPALGTAETAYLKHAAARGVPIVGLCTGVFLLVEAGLLDGYRACVSWFHHQDFIDRFDAVEPVADRIFVVDRDRLTCSGGQGTAHLAAHLVARHVGRPAAIKSLNIMMIENALAGDEAQPGQPTKQAPRDPLVKRAILAMQQRVEQPLAIADLAARLSVGRRTLERRFHADIGQSPASLYRDLRLDRAVLALTETQAPIADIAAATGFCDATHLSRTLKSARGISPLAHRRRPRPDVRDETALAIE